MASKPTLRALGLYTAPNEVALQDGALIRANNVVIRTGGVIEPRRGYERLSYQPTVTTGKELFFYGSTALYHYDSKLAYDTGAAWTEYSGTYVAPDPSNLRMKGLEAQGNFYFTTSAGVYRLSSTTGTPALAGAPHAPGVDKDDRVYTALAGDLERTGGNTVTALCLTAHGFYVGQSIQMTSAGEANFANGTKTVASVPDQFTFTYAETGANAVSGSDQTFAAAVLVDTGWLADGYHAAYRIVFDDPDANTKRKVGAASGRLVIANTSGTVGYSAATARNVWLRVLLPDDVTTNCYVQVFRSESVAATADPGEDLGLVYEVKIKPTDVTAGYVDIKDIVPDALIGPSIYISPNLGSSPADNNHRPPLAKDLVHWNDRVFYANTQDVQRFECNLIAVGSPSGLQDSDKIRIGSETYHAQTTPTGVNAFKVYTSGTTAQNIQNTATALVAAINRASTSYHASYESAADETPGRISIFARSVSTAAFSLYAYDDDATNTTARASFAPVLGGTPPAVTTGDLTRVGTTVTCDFGGSHSFQVGDRVSVSPGNVNFSVGPHTITAITSTTILWTESGAATSLASQTVVQYDPPTSVADTSSNRIMYSKPGELEAVPLLNYFDVGARNKRIWRVARLGDRLFVFKEDGVFQVTGDAPFRVDEVDPTIPLATGAADSVAVVDNAVCAMTTKGAVAITEAGAQLIGGPVYDLQTQSSWGSLAGAYESENLYLVRGVNQDGSSGVFAYNTKENAWTYWDLLPTAMRVQPSTGKLWLVQSDFSVHRERKDFLETDYRDRTYSVTLTAYNATTNAFTVTGATPAVGDVVHDAFSVAGLVGSGGAFTVTSGNMTAMVGQAMTLSKAYSAEVIYAAQTNGQPANEKHASDCTWHFRKYKFYEPVATFKSDHDTTEETVAIKRADRSITHALSWNSIYRRSMPVNKRTGVPKDMAKHAYLWVGFRCNEAFGFWALNGFTLVSNTDGHAGSR